MMITLAVFGSDLSMWKFYNLLTGSNKSSYIDSFLDRAYNATELATVLHPLCMVMKKIQLVSFLAVSGIILYYWFLKTGDYATEFILCVTGDFGILHCNGIVSIYSGGIYPAAGLCHC